MSNMESEQKHELIKTIILKFEKIKKEDYLFQYLTAKNNKPNPNLEIVKSIYELMISR